MFVIWERLYAHPVDIITSCGRLTLSILIITTLPTFIMNTETKYSSEDSLFSHDTKRKSSSGLYSGSHGFKFEST